jgi:hypothetical protein
VEFFLSKKRSGVPPGCDSVGVGSNTEPSVPLVGGTNGGSSKSSKPRVIAVAGKRSNNGAPSERSDCCDILQEHDSWSKNANGIPNVLEDCSFIFLT